MVVLNTLIGNKYTVKYVSVFNKCKLVAVNVLMYYFTYTIGYHFGQSFIGGCFRLMGR